MISLVWSFLKRDRQNASAFQFFSGWVQAALSALFWFFLVRFLGQGVSIRSRALPADYLTFGLVGLAVAQYVWRNFISFSNRLKELQVSGAFELLWLSPYPFLFLTLLFTVWDFFCATLYAATVLGVGALFLGARLSLWQSVQILGLGSAVGVSSICYALLVASCNLAWGGGEGVRGAMSRALPLVSGVYFPVQILPALVKTAALLLPVTHALFLARQTVWLGQAASAAVWIRWGGLTAALLLLAFVSWQAAVRRARLLGRLTSA